MLNVRRWWRHIPVSVRKPIVFMVGSFFILAAAATGWLPGPGGIPLFLIGIAILATEFVWAERLKHKILNFIKHIAIWYKAWKLVGTILLVGCLSIVLATLYIVFFR